MTEIRPHKGPQEAFLSTPADIAIYGGSAGAGKSFVLLVEPLRNIETPGFNSTTFRRQMGQLTAGGGLWDTSKDIYPHVGGEFIQNPLRWVFPAGTKAEFHHLNLESDVYKWDGSQLCLINFDELQHFTEKQFFYMLTRNRSTCGVRPYCRATCNPDPDSWLLPFLLGGGYIDEKTGYAKEDMSGVIRFFVRRKDVVYWADSREELEERFGSDCFPKSFTFIPAKLSDNPTLQEKDPSYIGNLLAQPQYEQDRLLHGNWFARPSAGELLRRSYFKIVETEPTGIDEIIRYWDRAATAPSETNKDPDYTAGVKMARLVDGRYIILDIDRDRVEPLEVEQMIKRNAAHDEGLSNSLGVTIGLEKDPGQAGKQEVEYLVRQLSGYNALSFPKTVKKLTMWKPFAAAAKAGNVLLLKGVWNKAFLDEAEGVTDGSQKGHDDQIDAAAGAFMYLATGLENFSASNMRLY